MRLTLFFLFVATATFGSDKIPDVKRCAFVPARFIASPKENVAIFETTSSELIIAVIHGFPAVPSKSLNSWLHGYTCAGFITLPICEKSDIRLWTGKSDLGDSLAKIEALELGRPISPYQCDIFLIRPETIGWTASVSEKK
jgi:hypothetical protein